MAESIKKFVSEVEEALKNIIFDTHTEIILNTPVDTGRLRSSIVVEETEDGYIIGTPVEYAADVELGTAPHKIVAKDKKSLKFIINGQEIFRKSVNHPGTEGSHMFLKGVSYFEQRINDLKNTI